jgi:hypothetical protein
MSITQSLPRISIKEIPVEIYEEYLCVYREQIKSNREKTKEKSQNHTVKRVSFAEPLIENAQPERQAIKWETYWRHKMKIVSKSESDGLLSSPRNDSHCD